MVARHHGRLALGCNSLLLLLGLQDRFVQLCERSMAAVLPPEGHAPEIVRTTCLDQQGSIDLGRRWLGACVDDVPPGGDATVDAEYVENQANVVGPPAGADRFGPPDCCTVTNLTILLL